MRWTPNRCIHCTAAGARTTKTREHAGYRRAKAVTIVGSSRERDQNREVSEAQRYAESVEGRDELRPGPGLTGTGGDGDLPWRFVPAGTGTTQASRNPFLPLVPK